MIADIAGDLAGLERLAERALAVAMRYADRLETLGPDEDERAVALSRPFQAAARSYRQSLALKARLRRELEGAEHDRAVRAGLLSRAPVEVEGVVRRMTQVEQAVRPLIWSEHEGAEAEALEDELTDALGEAFEDAGFARLSLQAQAAEIARRLDLAAESDAEPEPCAAPGSEARSAPATPPPPAPTRLPGLGAPIAAEPPLRPPDPPYVPPWDRTPGRSVAGGSGW